MMHAGASQKGYLGMLQHTTAQCPPTCVICLLSWLPRSNVMLAGHRALSSSSRVNTSRLLYLFAHSGTHPYPALRLVDLSKRNSICQNLSAPSMAHASSIIMVMKLLTPGPRNRP
jgi:hypothetical protein